jgi:hypothetical protein
VAPSGRSGDGEGRVVADADLIALVRFVMSRASNPAELTQWGRDHAETFQALDPETLTEFRAAYAERLAELKGRT